MRGGGIDSFSERNLGSLQFTSYSLIPTNSLMLWGVCSVPRGPLASHRLLASLSTHSSQPRGEMLSAMSLGVPILHRPAGPACLAMFRSRSHTMAKQELNISCMTVLTSTLVFEASCLFCTSISTCAVTFAFVATCSILFI